MNIAIDTLGGDRRICYCSKAGAVTGVNENPDVKVFLAGPEKELRSELSNAI